MSILYFTKMQGIGNDYIYVDCLKGCDFDPCKLAILMSVRHLSVGADGLVMICDSNVADAKMRIFNADGSEGMMCGNAIRCVGKYLYDNGLVNKKELTIDTLSGIKKLFLNVEKGKVVSVRVDMGIATVDPSAIPVLSDKPMLMQKVKVDGKEYAITAVSMGNPHCVIYVDNVADFDVKGIGEKFESNKLFPNRVNTEFVQIINENSFNMRVWERGSGETFACGTGASAATVASVLNGFLPYDTPIKVGLLGGELTIEVKKDLRVFMTGAATKVYDGAYEYED